VAAKRAAFVMIVRQARQGRHERISAALKSKAFHAWQSMTVID
jgi:hypothetical protein